MVTGIFGILKSGAAYLPIDPDYPENRIDYMLKDSSASYIIKRNSYPVHGAEAGVTGHPDKPYPSLSIIPTASSEPAPLPLGEAGVRVSAHPPATQLIYIIYTSGSTGRPKGVALRHDNVVNLHTYLVKAFPFYETDTFLLKTPFIFDVSVSELFGWFLGGGRLAVMGHNDHKEPLKLIEAVERYCVTHINFVPSMFGVFLDFLDAVNLPRLASLRYFLVGGEVLPAVMVERFNRLGSKIQMVNLYGPTEATVYATQYPTAEWKGGCSLSIGRPLANYSIYLLSRYDKIQPIGVTGELCIGGASVAEGYINRPELTAQRFNKSFWESGTLFSKRVLAAGGTIYKTGDLARWMADGNLEFFGRIDDQVKIRGYRIELGEIENLLLSVEGVSDAVVMARDDSSGLYLCAYVVGETIDENALRNFLASMLPDYMVPSFIVQLERIPLTPGGKASKRELPAPDAVTGTEYAAPRDHVESPLLEMFGQILSRDKKEETAGDNEKQGIGIDDNFFRLGGHSLQGTVLISNIHKVFNVNLSLTRLFANPTVRGLAEAVREAERERFASIPAVEKKQYYPLSAAQKRMYILNRMQGDSIGYNMPQFIPLEMIGEIDPKRLQEIFMKLIHRHESLRTSFHLLAGEPVQVVHDAVSFQLEEAVEDSETDWNPNDFIRPFDLSRAPLVRAGIGTGRSGAPVLMVDMHHIISDGVSMDILRDDFLSLYSGKAAQSLRIHYKDAACWYLSSLTGLNENGLQTFWTDRFSDEVPVLQLPQDFTRPDIQSFKGSSYYSIIDGERRQRLNHLALDNGSTLFMLMLSITTLLLSKLSGPGRHRGGNAGGGAQARRPGKDHRHVRQYPPHSQQAGGRTFFRIFPG